MLIIDTETTGLNGIPADRVLEIGICELDGSGNITPLYNELIRYPDIREFDSKYVNRDGSFGVWIYRNSDMRIEDTLNAEKDLDTVVREVRELVSGKAVTAYNTDFDFDKFLFREPWCLQDIVTVDFDIMKLATDRVYGLADSDRISNKVLQARLIREREQSPYPNKWVSSQDAYSVMCPDDPMDLGTQTHRALDDAIMEAWVLKALQ